MEATMDETSSDTHEEDADPAADGTPDAQPVATGGGSDAVSMSDDVSEQDQTQQDEKEPPTGVFSRTNHCSSTGFCGSMPARS